jgi:hypothetical protein
MNGRRRNCWYLSLRSQVVVPPAQVSSGTVQLCPGTDVNCGCSSELGGAGCDPPSILNHVYVCAHDVIGIPIYSRQCEGLVVVGVGCVGLDVVGVGVGQCVRVCAGPEGCGGGDAALTKCYLAWTRFFRLKSAGRQVTVTKVVIICAKVVIICADTRILFIPLKLYRTP